MAAVISLAHQPAPPSRQALDRLKTLMGEDLAEVNDVILSRMHSRVPLIPELAGHIIAAGGKRLRPLIVLACARLCGYAGSRHVRLSACVEFIHTATLLHDDVVDDSGLRRGNATANAVWGNQASVLVGDFLFSRAFQLMVEDGSLRVLDILSSASAVIAEGEVLQLLTTNDTATTEDAYLEVISAKTAALFAAAARLGAVAADRPRTEEAALESFGRNLGIAFQLADDVLDYSAHEATLGKTVGDDFREGKITLPIVLAFRRGADPERAFWQRTLEDGERTDADLEQAIAYLDARDALADTLERARHYGAKARDALGIFPESEIKRILLDVVDFCVDRAH